MGLAKQAKIHIVTLCCLVLGLWGLVHAFQYGSASLSFYRVKNILSVWQIQGKQQSQAQYTLAKQAIENALSHHPDNPLYVDVMAQIYEWGAIAGYEDNQLALGLAKQYYLRATQLRHSWPVTWASLAMVKWRLQEFDDELLHFLAQANKFGPLKPEVHILYSQFGLALYKNNHPMLIGLRPEFETHLALGLRNPSSSNRLIKIIESSGLDRQVCRWLRNEPEWTIMILEECKALKRKKQNL
jgi:tetratricopeptide (TPR) repeat protein